MYIHTVKKNELPLTIIDRSYPLLRENQKILSTSRSLHTSILYILTASLIKSFAIC
jgi:hypothetical protein